MTLSEIVKKVRVAAARQVLSLKSLFTGREFQKFKKDYFVTDLIGKGGFGLVFAAISNSGEPVAVKFVERRNVIEWGKNDEGFALPMEIVMLSRCSDIEGIISLIKWFSVPDGFLIVMERPLVSIDLYSFITEHGHLNEDLTLFLFRQVVESVYALMQRKILHRDIKNENIVIDLCTGATKLIDFGAATSMKSTRHHGFQGTRLYSPPEFLIHSLYLGEEAAVWSLGVVLFACLNGQLPYQSTKDICTSHLLGPLPRLTEFSAAAEQTIQNCLSFDPFKRISLEALRSSDWIRSGEDLDWDALAKQKTEDSCAESLDQRAESGVGSSDGSGRRTIKERALAAKIVDAEPKGRQSNATAVIRGTPAHVNPNHNTCPMEVEGEKDEKTDEKVRSLRKKRMALRKMHQTGDSHDSGTSSFDQGSRTPSPIGSPIILEPTRKGVFLP